MSTPEREKLEDLYGIFSEAAKTKGPYAHIQPKTCGDVADVLGRQIEDNKEDEAEFSSREQFMRFYRTWKENDETGR